MKLISLLASHWWEFPLGYSSEKITKISSGNPVSSNFGLRTVLEAAVL